MDKANNVPPYQGIEVDWYTSKEVQKALKISGCTLMHLRQSGKITYQKKGNAYFYQLTFQLLQ